MDARWEAALERWLRPFVAALGHKTRRRMCPAYIAGLIGPGDRKSVQPMASRDSGVTYDQLHHFIGSGVWDAAPLKAALLAEADKMVGSVDAWLIVDDTALPKKGAALGRRRCAICLGARQERQLSDDGIGNPGIARSARDGRAEAVSSGMLD
jgi:SRSO17 transposase